MSTRRVSFWLKAQSLIVVAAIGFLSYFALVTHNALCSFRDDLERRHDLTASYLEQPGPVIRVGGLEIEREVIDNQLASQKATLDALENGFPPLVCG